jgi:hypothetical protein
MPAVVLSGVFLILNMTQARDFAFKYLQAAAGNAYMALTLTWTHVNTRYLYHTLNPHNR